MRFFLVFPNPVGLDRRFPWFKATVLVPVAYMGAISAIASVGMFFSLSASERLVATLAPPWAFVIFICLNVAMFGVGVGSLVWQAARARTRGDRRRVVVVLVGAVAGLLPLVITLMAAAVTDRQGDLPLWIVIVVALTLPIFPLSFVYAVVRHRVLGPQVIVRRGIRYALVSRALLAIEAAIIFGIVLFGLGHWLPRLVPDADTGAMLTTSGIFTLVATIGMRSVNRRLKPFLDRRFFRDPYDAQRVLTELSAEIREHAAHPDRLMVSVALRLGSTFHPRHVAVYLGRSPDEPVVSSIRSAVAGAATEFECRHLFTADPATGRIAESPAETAPSFRPEGLFVRAMTAHVAGGAKMLEVDLHEPRQWLKPAGRWRGTRRDVPSLRSADRDAIASLGTVLVVPLTTNEVLRGWLSLGEKLSEESYTREDEALVEGVGDHMAIALDYAELIARAAEQEAYRREMEIAREVQAGLFPSLRPTVPGLDYDGAVKSAHEVGGDSYDFLALSSGRLALSVGDISGKGVSAALLMASLQAMLRSRAAIDGNMPDRLIADVNALLIRTTDRSKFATLFYGVYDSLSRTLTYVNAGHNPPLLLRAGAGSADRLEPTGMALGLSTAATFSAAECRLMSGDLLVLYTDGVTEAFNAAREEFGEARLEETVISRRRLSAAALRASILDEVAAFCGAEPQFDDMTVVVAKVTT
jgi:sigma-B regulation protein RsbU (phosphoserine phosphatase)